MYRYVLRRLSDGYYYTNNTKIWSPNINSALLFVHKTRAHNTCFGCWLAIRPDLVKILRTSDGSSYLDRRKKMLSEKQIEFNKWFNSEYEIITFELIKQGNSI